MIASPKSEDSNKQTLETLNKVSASFCLAKWLHGTLHLQRGLTHSCHHPTAHNISIDEIQKNPASLNNTEQKKITRKMMLSGTRPSECQYCWNIEDSGAGHFSDRVHLSKNAWALPFIKEVMENPLSDQITPRYLEVSFSRACNFKCSYCAPAFSSKWAQEVRETGAYPTREHEHSEELIADLFPAEENPYTEAFWKWWPELKKKLHTFRITGGEPLLSPHTFRVLEQLSQDPIPNLQLAVNTNLGASQTVIKRFCELAKSLLENKKIAKLEIYTSLESGDLQAEYIRYGINAKMFWENLEFILDNLPEVRIVIMSTFNALSVTSFRAFLAKALLLREKYKDSNNSSRILLDISYLRHPFFQAANILTEDFHSEMTRSIEFMRENSSANTKHSWCFYQFEIQKLERIFEWMKLPLESSELNKQRRDFYRFFSEHDRRRGTNFLEVFPQMVNFWELCKQSL